MILISQNLRRYMDLPKDAVIRINLAWVENLEKLETMLSSFKNEVFMDLPVGRTKPPNNNYTIEELKHIFDSNSNVKYLAISNVESSTDIYDYIQLFNRKVSIVPKIETKKSIDNISNICEAIVGEKIIMLDHDDLFTDLIQNNVPPSNFFKYIEKLENFCKEKSVRLLRTRGVIFSDKDEYYY